MVSAAGDFVYAKFSEINVIIFDLLAVFTVKCSDSVSFYFLSPRFLFVKNQMASFQLSKSLCF